MTANRKVTARYAEIARFLGLHFNEEFCVAYGEKDGFTLRVSGLDTGRGIEYGMVCISVGVAENGVSLNRINSSARNIRVSWAWCRRSIRSG